MAKQAGIHQLRGKLGEHSYYSQAGVSSGLVRRINQGMSQRVKTGDEYANTRLNNAEFGQACRIAGQIVHYVMPKFRPIPLLFSQSTLSKKVLELIKNSDGVWGQRTITDPDGNILSEVLSSMSKNRFDEYGVSVTKSGNVLEIRTDNRQSADKMNVLRADGYEVAALICNTYLGKYIPSWGQYELSHARYHQHFGALETDDEMTALLDYPSDAPEGGPWTDNKMVVIVLMPYRFVDNEQYILQKECAFKAFPKF